MTLMLEVIDLRHDAVNAHRLEIDLPSAVGNRPVNILTVAIHQDALDHQPLASQCCTQRRDLNEIHHDAVHHLTARMSIHRDPLVMVRTPRPKFQATKARRTSTWIHLYKQTTEDNSQTRVA